VACKSMRVVAFTAFAVLLPPHLGADEAKPKQKDSRFPQPTHAKLTTSATPYELKAGQAFTYQVKAKLDPGWKIFPYSPVQPERAPVSTKFDFFDTGGLKVSGDWRASKAVAKQVSPVFNGESVEFFEKEVTWSLRIIVPKGTKPGDKTLKFQACYQLLSDTAVTAPGRWTLPDVTIRIAP
jgi:hypothetical protein